MHNKVEGILPSKVFETSTKYCDVIKERVFMSLSQFDFVFFKILLINLFSTDIDENRIVLTISSCHLLYCFMFLVSIFMLQHFSHNLLHYNVIVDHNI